MVEQPIRNRQVVGSIPTLGSRFFGSNPEIWVTERVSYLGNNLSLPNAFCQQANIPRIQRPIHPLLIK